MKNVFYWIAGGALIGALAWWWLFKKDDRRSEFLEKARAAKAAKRETELIDERTDTISTGEN